MRGRAVPRAVQQTRTLDGAPRRPSGRRGGEEDDRLYGVTCGNDKTTQVGLDGVVGGKSEVILEITLERASGPYAMEAQQSNAPGLRAVILAPGVVVVGAG